MQILGIDPGLEKTGWALVQKQNTAFILKSSGLIETSKNSNLPQRLSEIFDGISRVLNTEKPDAAAIEELFFANKINTQYRTIQARGAILVACEKAGVKIAAYNPRTIKQTLTGNGSADKSQMQRMTQMTLNLKKPLDPDDIADAAAAALCHMRIAPFMEKTASAKSKQ
ncbi:MAG: crossover junction endodeoxyribonuclease RuvC [Elusimicrobia bacterium]|nr:crossover junction endodeoxyribonuclease RuvC [Elusimicrobiota bacterium]